MGTFSRFVYQLGLLGSLFASIVGEPVFFTVAVEGSRWRASAICFLIVRIQLQSIYNLSYF